MTKAKPNSTAPAPDRLAQGLGLLPAAVAALFVARPLVTSDAPARQGEGAVFVMLWLLLAVLWLLAQLRRGKLALRFGWTDAALLLLVAWQVVAALAATAQASPRPAINMLWEWIGVGLSFVLVRQLFPTAGRARALAASMLALGVALSVIGLYEYYIGAPQTRARYEQIKDDREQMLREVGHWYPPGSSERERFEDRLQSTEPTATFALANSLAGYLAPWLVVALAIAALPRRDGRTSLRSWLLVALVAAPMLFCLLLTKSRSAWLAVAGGLPIVWLVARRERRVLRPRLLLASAAMVVLLAGLAAWSGALDREVIAEAGKSLGYRLQYWQATTRMIRDEPLLGVGPGQFQDAYTIYKLPAASEEVQDPHNFLLEIWATAGTPALLLLIAALVSFTWRVFTTPVAKRNDEGERVTFILFGAALGVVLARALGALVVLDLDGPSFLIGLSALTVTLILLRGWVRSGTLSASLCWAAAVVLLVNLLAAGGIAYPGVAGSLWLLMALGLNLAGGTKPPRSYPPRVTVLAFAAVGLLAVMGYASAYRPVLTSRSLVARSYSEEMLRDPVARAELLDQAQQADPRAAEIARLRAAQRWTLWRQEPTPAALAAFEAAAEDARRLDPRSSSTWAELGRLYEAAYARAGEEQLLQQAIEHYRRAVELYPTSGLLRGYLARTLDAAGRDEAPREAAEALRLNELMREAGHEDRLLPSELQAELERIATGPGAAPRAR